MRKIRFMVLAAVLIFILPVSVLAIEDEPVVSSGIIEVETAEALECEKAEPQQVVDLENEYEARFQKLQQELTGEKNQWAREDLQKEIQNLKSEEELAFQELYLEMATVAGDLERVAELQQAVDSHYNVPEIVPQDISEPRQDPENDVILPRSTKRYPDDA